MQDSQYLTEDKARDEHVALGTTSIFGLSDSPATQIRGILADPSGSGVLLTGPAGTGRAAAFEAGFASLEVQPHLVRLNGTSFATSVPRGTLAFLLSRLELDFHASRHEVVHGLASLLCPDDRPSVVLLGRPELVDEESASLVAQLASMQKIILVVVCERLQDLPQDILALYRSGQLTRITMRRMDMGETRIYLESELGGQVSMFAAATLKHLTLNNRHLMMKLAHIWVTDGQLVQRGGVWVLQSSKIGSGPARVAILNSMISKLKEPERRLLYGLAMGGPIAVEALHRNNMVRQLDELRASGHVSITQRRVGHVAISIPLLSLLLRSTMDEDLRTRIGRDLELLHRDPVAAEVNSLMRASADGGDDQGLIEAAQEFGVEGYGESAWPLDPEQRLGILKLHVKTLLRLRRSAEASTVLTSAEPGLLTAARSSGFCDRMEAAVQEIDLLKDLVATELVGPVWTTQARERLSEIDDSPLWQSESLQLRARAAQILGWAARSRQADAMIAVQEFIDDLTRLRINGQFDEIFTSDEAAEMDFVLLQAQLLAGDWRGAAIRAMSLAEGAYPHPRTTASAEAVLGILHGLFDDGERALKVLNPVLQQLAFIPDAVEHAAVEAVITYSLVSRGQSAEATELLLGEPQPPRPETSLNFFSWADEIFSSMAVALFKQPAAAHSRLVSFADKVHDAGYSALEMHTLVLALRLGHPEVADRLQLVSSACHGETAYQYSCLAGAVRQNDHSLLERTLEELAVSGQMLLSSPVGNALVDTLAAKAQRSLSASLSRLKRQEATMRRGPSEMDLALDDNLPKWMGGLTKRESQVALLAIKGQGNSEIARSSGVSVRTVEGHLYQVYSKLQVRNRLELTALDRASRRVTRA